MAYQDDGQSGRPAKSRHARFALLLNRVPDARAVENLGHQLEGNVIRSEFLLSSLGVSSPALCAVNHSGDMDRRVRNLGTVSAIAPRRKVGYGWSHNSWIVVLEVITNLLQIG